MSAAFQTPRFSSGKTPMETKTQPAIFTSDAVPTYSELLSPRPSPVTDRVNSFHTASLPFLCAHIPRNYSRSSSSRCESNDNVVVCGKTHTGVTQECVPRRDWMCQKHITLLYTVYRKSSKTQDHVLQSGHVEKL